MLKIFTKLIVLPVMVILIALSFTVSILSKIHYLVAVLVNAIFIMCAVIALSLQQWQNFGIGVAGDELELLMHENQDVLKRLKERN